MLDLIETQPHPSLTQGLGITALYLGWRDTPSQLWLPVAKMTWKSDLSEYCFRYTQGMEKAIAISLIEKSAFIHHPQRLYQSQITTEESLKFKSRMPLSRTRDVPKQQEWFGLPPHPIDPIAYVSRSGGFRHGDNYDVFPQVTPDESGKYHYHFLPLDPWLDDEELYARILQLVVGQPLDIVDGKLKSGDFCLGSLPGYLSAMVLTRPDAVQIEVAKVNSKTPNYYSLLCHATVDGNSLTPFATSKYATFS